MKEIIILLLLLGSCKTSPNKASINTFFPENSNGAVVMDLSSFLSSKEEHKLISFEEKTSNQIAIITIDSINPYDDIQKYATDLGNYWSVGQKEKDNGLVIAICGPCRTAGITTGYGTEKILTDSICKNILETSMIPNFKEDRYYEGISIGLDSIIHKWNED